MKKNKGNVMAKEKLRKNNDEDTGVQSKLIASCDSRTDKELPSWNLKINELIIPALIDSGASISLLSSCIFEQIKRTNVQIKYLANTIKITRIRNRIVPFKHCIKFKLHSNNIFLIGIFFM